MKRAEAVQPIEVRPAAWFDFHAAPDVRHVLGYSPRENFYGKRVLMVGNIPERWNIVEHMEADGASVRSVSTFDDGNPITKVRPLPIGGVFGGPKYDRIAFVMSTALRKPAERVSLLQKALTRVDFENGGQMGAVAMDFSETLIFLESNPDPRLQSLGVYFSKFFSATKFDPRAGATLHEEVELAARGKNIDVQHTVRERERGTGSWEEVFDLLAFQEDVLKKIPALAPGVALARAELLVMRPRVMEILKLPQTERPELLPPVIHRVVAVKKEAATR